jgi:hypothetical protein
MFSLKYYKIWSFLYKLGVAQRVPGGLGTGNFMKFWT